MEKSWNFIKAEKSWKNHGILKSVVKLTASSNKTLKSVKSQEKLVQKIHSIDTLH